MRTLSYLCNSLSCWVNLRPSPSRVGVAIAQRQAAPFCNAGILNTVNFAPSRVVVAIYVFGNLCVVKHHPVGRIYIQGLEASKVMSQISFSQVSGGSGEEHHFTH